MRRRHRLLGSLVAALAAVLAGCSTDETPDALDPGGDEASRTALLWWLLLGAATLVALVIAGLILWGSLRSPRRNPGGLGDDSFIGLGGVGLPAVVLVATAVLTVAFTAGMRPAESPAEALRVEIVGHQWWWEISYPDLGIVTANELHIPVDRPVELSLSSADVIHSFWVPQLAGKQDLVPGQPNRLEIRADEIGSYWGVCAEFCGTQHANMSFVVFVDSDERFGAWVSDQQTADEPTGAAAERGRHVFESQPCGACHTIRGTEADGELGPDLTELGDRSTLGAGVLDNTDDDLALWITSVQQVKPGALMLSFDLPDEDVAAMVDYLRSER